MKTKLKNGMIVIAPEGCRSYYLTDRKEYEVFNVRKSISNELLFNFNIKNDRGKISYCLLKQCGHLNGKNWIIKNE